MPHESTLPPIPADILTPYQQRRKLERSFAARRYAESGKIRQHSTSPDDDALLALQAALQSGADPKQIQELLGQAETAHKTGFKEKFLNGLRAVGLPFEAFSESINALIGPAVPQEAFQRRSAQSRKLLKSMFGGDLSVAEAAGALREVYEERSGWEQLITGLVFDPLNFLVPGGSAIRAGLKGGLKAGLAAGGKSAVDWAAYPVGSPARVALQQGAKAGGREAFKQIPFVGGRIADHLGLQATARLLTDATKTHGPEWLAHQRRFKDISEGRLTPGGASDTEPEAIFELGKANWFFNAVEDPAQAAKLVQSPALKQLADFYKAGLQDATPAKKALLRLSIETAGRGFELGNVLVEDIDFGKKIIRFHSATRAVGRIRIEEFSDEAMTLLQEAVAGKLPGDPVFTHTEILGTKARAGKGKPKPVGDILGTSGLNNFVLKVAKAAGIPAPSDATIRVLVASAYEEAAILGGASPHVARELLAHAKHDFATYRTYGRLIGMSLHADVDSLARYITGFDKDVKYTGLRASTEGVAVQTAVGLGQEAKRVRAEIRKTPELKGVSLRLRKGKGGTAPILGKQAAQEGVTRLEQLPIDAFESWFSGLAAKDKAVLSVAVRMVAGLRTANDLDVVREYAEIAMGAAKTTGKSTKRAAGKAALSETAAAWQRVAQGSQDDIKRLYAGLGEYEQRLQPWRADLQRIMTELEGQGIVTLRDSTNLETELGAISQILKARSQALKSWYGSGGKITKDELERMGMDFASLQETPGLTHLELADITTLQAKVTEWLSSEKVRMVLSRYGIAVGLVDRRPIITERITALRSKLLRISASPAAHLLGNDMHTTASAALPAQFRAGAREIAQERGLPYTGKGPDEIMRSIRVTSIIKGLPPESLIELERKSLKTRNVVEDAATIVDLEGVDAPVRVPGRHTSAEHSTAPFLPRDADRRAAVEAMAPEVTIAKSGKNVRSNPLFSKVIDTLERDMATHPGWRETPSHMLRNLLQIIPLPGAALGDVPVKQFKGVGAAVQSPRNTLIGDAVRWGATLPEIETIRQVNRERFYNHIGQQQFDKQTIDVRSPKRWYSDDLRLAVTAMAQPEWGKLVHAFEGRLETFRGGLHTNPPASYSTAEKLAYDELHRPTFVFGGLPAFGIDPIPLERLTDFLELTPEQIDLIAQVREYASAATRMALDPKGKIGKAKAEEWAGGPLSQRHFPRVAIQIRETELKIPPLQARKLDQPGVWAKERKARDLVDARNQMIDYEYPIDSAVGYYADIQRLAVDQELIGILIEHGATVGKAKWEREDEASRTLLYLAEQFEAGKVPDDEALSHISKLLGYTDNKELTGSMVGIMGELAGALIREPSSAKRLMPEIRRIVAKSQEKYEATIALHDLTKGLPGLGNLYWEDSVQAQRALKFFGEQNKAATSVLNAANTASSTLRMMQAGIDVSPIMIQGLMLPVHGFYKLAGIGGTPGQTGVSIWGRAIGAAWRAMGTTEYHSAWVAKYGDDILDFSSHGGVWSELNEMVAGVGTLADIWGGTGKAITGLIGKPGWGYWLKNIPQAAERFFTVFLLHARLDLWRAMRHMAGGNEDALRQLASWTNNMTGVYNPATTGITQFQRHFEGTFVSFASMYRRSAYATAVNALRDPGHLRKLTGAPAGRLDTRLAQESLVSLMGAAVTMAFLAKEMGNNPEALNPHSARFLSFNVGGHYIGLGSAYYSLVRAAYAVTEQALDPDPEKGRRLLLTPSGYFNVRDNQLMRWWRSQAPPILQAGIDLILGQSYIGEPLRGADGGIMASAWKWAGSQITPMTMETMIRELRSPGDSPAVIGEGFGLRTFPMSLYERRRNLSNNLMLLDTDPDIVAWRQEQAKTGQVLEASQMPVLLRNRLESGHADLQAINAQIEKDSLLRGSGEQKRTTLYFQQYRKNRDFINMKMESAVAAYRRDLDPRAFRRAISEAKFAGAALSSRLGEEYGDVTTRLDAQKKVRAEKASAYVGDLVYDRYITNIVQNPLNEDQDGNFLPHVYEESVSRFIQEEGPDWWEYVQKRRKETKQYPSLVNEYFDAVDDLQPYWKLHHSLWGQFSANARLIDEYNDRAPLDREAMANSNPRLRRLLRTLVAARLKFRDQNPELDWLLSKWYGNVPRTQLARERLAAWQSQR